MTIRRSSPADDFGPSKLRLLHDQMIAGDPLADPPRPDWSRNHTNQQLKPIRHMFKWAVGRVLVPITVYQALTERQLVPIADLSMPFVAW